MIEIFNAKKQDHIRDIQDLLSHTCSRIQLDKIVLFLEKSEPKIKISQKKKRMEHDSQSTAKKTLKCSSAKECFDTAKADAHTQAPTKDYFDERNALNSSETITNVPRQCMAYIQSGRQCSRMVRHSTRNYCGLHTILHYGDITTGYLNKNTI